MKRGFFILLLIVSFISPGCGQSKEAVNEYQLIPYPNGLTPQKGSFKLTNGLPVVVQCPEAQCVADSFITRLKQCALMNLKVETKGTPGQPAIYFQKQEGLHKEGYKLSVSNKQITVKASTANGFFYAVQTLYQLLPPAIYKRDATPGLTWSIPAVEIEDEPRFAYRGLMLDVCRHFSPVGYIYRFIDMLAYHKMNVFHWHLTDDQGWRIEIKKYPKLIEIGSKRPETLIGYYFENYPQLFDGKEHQGYYTQKQIKEIVAYAASKHITVIPEIEMPGHALAALASYPELSCRPDTTYGVSTKWGIFNEVFCPKEETFAFLEGVLDEVMALFPSPYIHIGGDECPKTEWKNCAHCQALIKELGLTDDSEPNKVDGKKHSKEEKLQSYFITRMEKYLNAKGRNIIGWDEILEGGLAPNATVMSWRGVEGGLTAAKAGHNAIMTPGAYMYLDQYQENPEIAPTTIGGYATLKKVYGYNPVADDADALVKKHIIGLQGNIWNEYMPTTDRRDYQAFPRALAIAETAWTQNGCKNWNSFRQRVESDFARMDIIGVKACRNFFDVNIHTRGNGKNGLNVTLETDVPNAEIHYTTNGTEPTNQSTRYTQPFLLHGNLSLKAATFRNGKRLGSITSKPLYGNLISGHSFTVTPGAGWMTGDIWDDNHVLGSDKQTFGLTNGKRGYRQSYTPWVSFGMNESCKEVIFTTDLGKTESISKVVFGTLHNPAYKALPAGKAVVEISTDGVNYKKVAEETFRRQLPENGRKAFTDEVIFAASDARYVRLTIQNGGTLRNGIDYRKDNGPATIQANLYLDEIEVY